MWLVLVLLFGLAIWQHTRIDRLVRRVDTQAIELRELHDLLGRLKGGRRTEARKPAATLQPGPPLLAESSPADSFTFAPTPEPRAPRPAVATAAPLAPRIEPAAASHAKMPPPVGGKDDGRSIAAWLAENGLAWVGGGALALGGLLMVAYAAQRGFFTPILRIWAAVILGFVMVTVSEWIRRRPQGATSYRLGAAVTAGAGAATLYGAVLAAHGLYHFIDYPLAGLLLAAVSFGLLGLARKHGEPLGVLAMAGAFAAPLAGVGADPSPTLLYGYLLLVTATGLAASNRRGWNAAAAITILLSLLWTFDRAAGAGRPGALVLALAPAVISLVLAMLRRPSEAKTTLSADRRVALSLALVTAALAVPAIGMKLMFGAGPDTWPFAIAATALAMTVGAAVRGRYVLTGWLFAVVAAGVGIAVVELSAGVMMDVMNRSKYAATQGDYARAGVIALAPALLVGLLALWSARRSDSPRAVAGAGALAVLFAIGTVPFLGAFGEIFASASGAVGAVVLALGAAWLARNSDTPREDKSLAFWTGSAAAAAFIAILWGIDSQWLPVAMAAAAAVLALLARRLPWRGLAGAAVSGGVLAIGAMLSPALVSAAIGTGMAPFTLVVVTLAAAILLALGWLAIRGDESLRHAREGLSSEAVVVALLGAFWLLRHYGAAQGTSLDGLTEASLRTLLLLIPGVVFLSSAGEGAGPIGRWRPRVMIGAGLFHAIVAQVFWFNPWWGPFAIKAAGWPIVDSIAIGYLAPAVMMGLGALRRRRQNKSSAWLAASAFAWMVLWVVLELRRLFHGADMTGGLDTICRAEAGAYALTALVLAQGVMQSWRLSRAIPPQAGDGEAPTGPGDIAAWIALALSLLVFGYVASPWWGPVMGPVRGPEAIGLFALYAAAVAGAAALAWPAARRGHGHLRTAAIVAGLVQLFALITLIIRWLFQGADMRTPMPEESLETWAFSAVWAIYGLGVLTGGMARRNLAVRWVGLVILLATTAKVFLFDMARLEGVIRAASFLALGALLVGGALISRKLRDGLGLNFPKKPADPG